MLKVIDERAEWRGEDGRIVYGMALYKEHCINKNCKKHQDNTKFFYPKHLITSKCPECKQPLLGGKYFGSIYSRVNYHLT